MLLVIDNYDSFTFNLVHYFEALGVTVKVVNSHSTSVAEVQRLGPDRIVLSPGPGRPEEAGVTMAVLESLAGQLPILGVCLGHQAIGQAFGARVQPAKQVMHGKVAELKHAGDGIFAGLPPRFAVVRYHSLALASSLPSGLRMTAWTETQAGQLDEIMAIEHERLPIYGLQFHPESVLSEQGHLLLTNFLKA
jgi:anthranilate synthase component 2